MASSGGAGSGHGWSALWQNNLTPWDLSGPTAALQDEFAKAVEDGRLPRKGARTFVPGCGSAYDVAALAKNEFQPLVVGLDIAPEAIEKARGTIADSPGASVVCGDFFTHPLQTFDFIFDYTFFCALPPELRGKW